MLHLLTALASVLLSTGSSAVGQPYQFHPPVGHRTPASLTAAACPTPAPTTADGYTAMFGKLDPTAWGAGDTALTVPMGGRSVWIYSDTAYAKPGAPYDVLSGWARMTHSSAVVQTGGCLHVSAAGAQVLPNDPSGLYYYWIDSATALSSTQLRVVGYEMAPGAQVGTGRFRAAVVNLSAAGDLTFDHWIGFVAQPALPPLTKDGGYLGNSVSMTATGQVVIPAVFPAWTLQYSYSPQTHRELRLASGKTLVSIAVGWSGDAPHAWTECRPIYREVTLP